MQTSAEQKFHLQMGPQIDCMFSTFNLTRRWPKTSALVWHSTAASQKSEVTLPQLPVPPLESTLQKFLRFILALSHTLKMFTRISMNSLINFISICCRTAKPHLSSSELKDTIKAIEEFGKKGGIGEELQARLERRAQSKGNWVCAHIVHLPYQCLISLKKFLNLSENFQIDCFLFSA